MKRLGPPPEIASLLLLLDEAYNKRSWHGTNLRGSIRGLTAEQAGWHPAPGKHCIADIVVHAAYWKYAAWRRLRGEKRGSFPLKGSNWFDLPEPLSEPDWKSHVRLLNDTHDSLREAVAATVPKQLEKPPPGGKTSRAMLIRGIALHDVYHAGQIQVIKGLLKQR